MTKLKTVKLQKDTTLTIRVNSLLKDHLHSKAESAGQTLTEYLTGLAFKDLKMNETELTRQALSS